MLFMDEVNGFLGGGAEKDNSATIAVRTMMLNFLEGEKKGLEISSPPPPPPPKNLLLLPA